MKKKILSFLITILAVCMCMFTLTACGDKEPPHTHTYDQQVVNDTFKATNATCEDKATYYYSCTCGEKGTETFESGEALGHSFTNYVYNNDAKCEQDGTQTAVCDNGCGVSSTIPKWDTALGHSFTNYEFNDDAKCGIDGTETAICDHDCGESDTKIKSGSALEHAFSTPKYTWEDDKCTATRVCSRDNTHIETETVTAVYQKDTDATCTTPEKGHYKATFTNSAFIEQTTVVNSVENGKELGHLFTNYTFNNDAKCGIDGTETAICDNGCGEEDTRKKVGSALEHDYSAWATNNNGTHTRTCSHNNSHKETKNCNGGVATCKAKAVCIDCGAEYGSLGHIAKEEWSTTEKYHYHACKTENCTEKLDKENHTFDKNKKCTVCDYVTTELMWTEISSDVFAIDGTNLYVKVPNKQTYFAFAETINVAEGATYKVYSDIQCKEESNIPSYMVNNLVVGNNTYYFLVSNEGSFPKIYTVTVRRRPMYAVTFSVNGGTTVDKQVVEEDGFATEPTTTKTGYTFDGWDYDFTTPITQKTNITASWVANTDTKYTVIYYLQNLNDNNYTPYETLELKGTTNTTAKAEIKEYAHFTYYSYKSTISGNISPAGSLILRVYYTRDSYTIVSNSNNEKAGTIAKINSKYKYEKEITLTATTNDGYTFLGWYEGETCVCETEEFVFKAEKAVTYTANWEANTDTKYTVIYYLQNLNDNNYTPYETIELKGTTNTTAKAEIKEYTHFTYNVYKSTISGNIDGNGSRVLSVYYIRDTYTIVSNSNNEKAGTIAKINSKYKYEKEITLTATTNVGYTFLGWYEGETCVCETEEFTFKAEKDVTHTAKFEIVTEMANFNFTSTATTCSITGIIDKTITEIIVPDCVTSISQGAFADCSSLTSIVIPNSVTSIGGGAFYNCPIEKAIMPTLAISYVKNSSLKEVVLTSGTSIGNEAFRSCRSLTSVVIGDSVTSIGDYAFMSCLSLKSVVIGDSVTSIGGSAFCDCNKLVEVINKSPYITIEKGATSNGCVGENAFAVYNSGDNFNGTKLSNYNGYIVYVEGNEKILVDYNGQETELVLPTYITKINQFAFSSRDSLYSVVIGDSVTSMGEGAFFNSDSLTSVVIGDSVTSIGDMAFYDCDSLTSVVIGDSVTSIGNRAFEDCSSLTSIEIPDSAESIGESAFKNCTSLTSVVIGNSVTSIGDDAFYDCRSLRSVVIGNSVTSIGDHAFYNCYKIVEVINKSSHITIGKGMFSNGCVGYYASVVYNSGSGITESQLINDNGYIFYSEGNEKILVDYDGTETELVLPTYITKINRYAFSGCSSLTSIEIPNSVTSIGDYAFRSCSLLTSIVIPSSITSIPYRAFFGCSSLTSIVIPDSVTSIVDCAFEYCSSLTSIVIPDSVTSIGYGAFEDCSSLTSIVIPDSVTSIGKHVFYGCSSLTSVVIPDSVTRIGEDAFRECSSLTSIEIPDSVTSIGDRAFEDCSSLTSIEIPDRVTSVGKYLFYGCSSLTSVVIPDSVTSIGENAFDWCESLTSIEIPDSVTSIGNWAFGGCTSLTSVVILDSVTSIGDYAFYGCSSLTSIEIPNSVTSIGECAFCNCTSLTSIEVVDGNLNYKDIDGNLYSKDGSVLVQYAIGKTATIFTISDSVTSIGDYAFCYCDSLTSVVIPDSVTSIGEGTFYDCSSLTSVVIGDSVTSIGDRAFCNCDSLTSITFNGTMEEWNALEKGSKWNNSAPATYVQCSDGTVRI